MTDVRKYGKSERVELGELPWMERWALRLLIWHARRRVSEEGTVRINVTIATLGPIRASTCRHARLSRSYYGQDGRCTSQCQDCGERIVRAAY